MSALKERTVRHHAQRSRLQQRGSKCRIIVLGEGEGAASAGGGSNRGFRFKATRGGVNGDEVVGAQRPTRNERFKIADAVEGHHRCAKGAALSGESCCPDQIVSKDVEVWRNWRRVTQETVQVSPAARSFCRSTGPFAARAAFALSTCSTRS